MPYTLSHPLAVVPLRRWCPDRFNFAALVIGSMSPDFGYFVEQFSLAKYAHSIPGMFAVGLPSSLIVLGLFYLLRRPLCFVLPQPHRGALTPLASAEQSLTARSFAIASISVLVGTLTHIVWDSFAHYDGWPVEKFRVMRLPLFVIAGIAVPPFYLIQIVSSILGAVGLIAVYVVWLRRQPKRAGGDQGDTDRWRYILLGGVSTAALAIAAMIAFYHVRTFRNGPTIIEGGYWTAVYSISVFFPFLALSSVIAYAANGSRHV
jgi:hypothetical protein